MSLCIVGESQKGIIIGRSIFFEDHPSHQWMYVDDWKQEWQDNMFHKTADTVKVIMLVCDTTKTQILNIYQDINISPDYYNHSIYWERGYEIQIATYEELSTTHSITFDEHGSPLPTVQEYKYIYLDKNKKPLSKNIIIWQTKPL